MKKRMSFLIVLCTLLFATHAVGESTWPERDAMVRKAHELALQMDVLAGSEDYMGAFTPGDSSIISTAKSIAAYDYRQPSDAIVIFADDAFIRDVLDWSKSQGFNFPEEEWFTDVIKGRIYFQGLFNSRAGVNWLAACSMLQITEGFVLEGARGGIGYVIFLYEEGQPSVVTQFNMNADSSVLTSASFVKLPEGVHPRDLFRIDDLVALLKMIPEDTDLDLSPVKMEVLNGDTLAEVLGQKAQ